jgi:hypothetical protein
MRFAKFIIGLIASGPRWSNYFVALGFIIRNPVLPTKGRHEHTVDEDDGFGFHNELLPLKSIFSNGEVTVTPESTVT